jgi:serine/threonine protein kinase
VTRWRKGEKLGWGRFGVVFACQKVGDSNGHDYAIKYLQTDWVKVPEAVKRFEREVAILEGPDHPNVMPVEQGHAI